MAKPVLKDISKSLTELAHDAGDRLEHDVDQTVADARDVVSQAATILAQAAQVLADQAREQSKIIAGQARVRAETAAKAAQDDIRDHPLSALGLALGVGLVIGFLTSGRRR